MTARGVSHFARGEMRCPCCGRGAVALALVLALEDVRTLFGGPVVIASGWRCAAHNARVGGHPQSRHLVGCAVDVAPRPSEADRWEALRLAVVDVARKYGSDWSTYSDPVRRVIHFQAPRGARLPVF